MARRLQISRQRAVGQRPALLLGLNARLAVCVVVLFTVASLVAYRLTNLGSEHARARWSVASAWADRLMYGAELTPYGWVPEERAARAVDEDLSSVQAAFVLLDAADRVVRASECLLMRTASVVRTGVGDRINIPPLGEVVVTRLPVRVFGERQGTFLLLSKGSGAAVPVPKPWSRSYEPPAEQVIAVAPDWSFILVGVLLMGLGAYLAVYVFATARLNRMTSVALGSNPGAQAPRRFSATGGDEIGNLADALNAMQRRTLRRVATMTERESNRRDWLSELSHDLRTPLSALQLRLDNARGAQPDRLAETVATAADDCQRIQTLAKGFMDLAGLEVTEDFAFEPVMPEELVGQAVRGLSPIAEAAGVRLTTRLTPQPTIWVDGHRMLRALENILRNAIRHASAKVVIGVERVGTQMRFFVRDDGEGFSELSMGEPVDYSGWLGRRQTGGLGLRVADRVARAHGGRLVICNGTTGTLVICIVHTLTEAPDDWDEAPSESHQG